MRWVAIALLALLLAVVSFLAWLGAFATIAIQERPIGPYTFVYRELSGATPADVGRVTEDLEAELGAAGVTGLRPLGVYAPDGSAQIGVAVGGGADAAAKLPGARVRELVAERGLVATFPRRIPMSFLVAYLKVNSAFERHREAMDYEIAPAWVLLEGDTIVSMMPVVAREDP